MAELPPFWMEFIRKCQAPPPFEKEVPTMRLNCNSFEKNMLSEVFPGVFRTFYFCKGTFSNILFVY